jgi:hypothetical protein
MAARCCLRRATRHMAFDHEQFRAMALRISSENSTVADNPSIAGCCMR